MNDIFQEYSHFRREKKFTNLYGKICFIAGSTEEKVTGKGRTWIKVGNQWYKTLVLGT